MPASLPNLLRRAAICCPIIFCLPLPGGGADAGEALHAFLSDANRTLSFTTCGGEEAGECLSHELPCGDRSLSLLVMGGEEQDTRAIARSLLSAPWGEAKLRFRAARGATADVPVASFTVELDEMNSDWDLTLRSFDTSAFFAAVSKKTARSAAVEIAGTSLPLAPRAGDEAKLLAFKKACDA